MVANRAADHRYRQRLKERAEAQNLLPFRVPCPTPITAKVYLPPRGSVALSFFARTK